MQQSVLPELKPCIQVAELKVLAELPEEIHQLKLHEEARKFLASGFMGLPCARIKVSHQNGFLVLGAGQYLLQFWEVLQGGGGEV